MQLRQTIQESKNKVILCSLQHGNLQNILNMITVYLSVMSLMYDTLLPRLAILRHLKGQLQKTSNDMVWRSVKLLLLDRNSSSCALYGYVAAPCCSFSLGKLRWPDNCVVRRKLINPYLSMCEPSTFILSLAYLGAEISCGHAHCHESAVFHLSKASLESLKRKLHENDLFQAPKVTTSTQSTALPSALQTNKKTESNQELKLKNNNIITYNIYYIILY